MSGDIHQPMHIENLARGGNDIPVCWGHACNHNLHSVWDTSIPHAICNLTAPPPSPADERVAARAWAGRLRARANATAPGLLAAECARVGGGGATEDCALGWAREANAFVCSHVMDRGVEWFRGRDLSGEYYERAAPVVEHLVGKAGVRLAAWLEAMVAAARRGGEPVVKVGEEPAVSGAEERVVSGSGQRVFGNEAHGDL
jgi:hypothetical protein